MGPIASPRARSCPLSILVLSPSPSSSTRSRLDSPTAIALGVALDTVFVEPPQLCHPVALFGRLVAPVDRDWRRPRVVGALATVCLPLGAAVLAGGVVGVVARRGPVCGTLAAAGVVFVTTSRRLLTDTARKVTTRSETDLLMARRELRALAGRDATALSAGQVRSAAIESAAENLADGWCGPLLAFAICAPRSLALGAGAAAWVKAVNTMDSMLGYRSVPTGWAPARLDDRVMWVPARLSALAIALAAGDPLAFSRARNWARAPSSPNAGWPMATLAAVLDVRLEKPDTYTLNPDRSLPAPSAAREGTAIVDRAALLVALVACLTTVFVSFVQFHTSQTARGRWLGWS
jgi:adenosylcobinamide-phosphate synthase